MGKKKGPSPPDPVKTAQAQYEYNRQAAEDSARFNQINQVDAVGQWRLLVGRDRQNRIGPRHTDV